MKFLTWFFSGEVFFTGFLVGYVLTAISPAMPNVTIIFFFLSIVSALKRLFENPKILKLSIFPIIIFILLLSVITLSIFYSSSNVYSLSKVIEFYTLTSWSFLGVYFLLKDKESLDYFLRGIILFSLIVSILLLITSIDSVGVREGLGGANNLISLARIAGLGIISVIGLNLYNTSKKNEKILSIIFIVLLTSSLLITGSRGPLVGVVIGIIIFMLFSFQFSYKRKEIKFNKGIFYLAFSFLVGLPILKFISTQGYFDSIFLRFEVLFNSSGGGSSVIQRYSRFEEAKDMFINSPIIGGGIGSFPISYSGVDVRDYPHNIILEILSELGLIGFLLFSLLLLYSLFLSLKQYKNYQLNACQLTVIVLFVYLFINANISGDINTNRMFFSLIAILTLIPLYNEESDVFIDAKTSS